MSKRETELRNMELAEIERKQNLPQDGENKEHEKTPIKQNGEAPSPAAEQTDTQDGKGQSGPVLRIVNGEIVLDAASLQVDRHADADKNVGELEDVVENSLTRRVNQSSYGKRTKAESWDEEMTDLFYRGLRMFGTDFMMISKLFPNRSRHQIKLKFNNEERRRPEKIKRTLLGPGEFIDIETYSEMTNTVYDDPRVIQQELDEDKKRIEGQHAKEKEAQEEMLRNPGGTGTGASNADAAADAPVKGKTRNNKKQAAKGGGGGTEEVVGSIDDFA
jgi:transcription factor TFIIIB component B''